MSITTTDSADTVTITLTAQEAAIVSSAITFESTDRCAEDLATEGLTVSSREAWHRAVQSMPPLLTLADQVMPSVEAGVGATVTAPRAALLAFLDKSIGDYEEIDCEAAISLSAIRERVGAMS